STISGEDRVKNVGQDWVSFRHTTLPLAASRQETTPLAPKVQILPSATAGELRVPGPSAPMPTAAPVTGRAWYLSCHKVLPLAASRQVVTSCSPLRGEAEGLFAP